MKTKSIPFSRLSKKGKRIEIAKDVLARLSSKQLTVRNFTWLDIHVPNTEIYKKAVENGTKVGIQPLIQNNAKCECCALGGVICSLIGYENKFDEYIRGNFDDEFFHEPNISVDYDDLQDRLENVFDHDQLMLIEYCFENGNGNYSAEDVFDSGNYDFNFDGNDEYKKEKPYKNARKFIRKHRGSNSRFKAIFENIINNDGTFIP